MHVWVFYGNSHQLSAVVDVKQLGGASCSQVLVCNACLHVELRQSCSISSSINISNWQEASVAAATFTSACTLFVVP